MCIFFHLCLQLFLPMWKVRPVLHIQFWLYHSSIINCELILPSCLVTLPFSFIHHNPVDEEESMTLFHGEDFHLELRSPGLEVTFRNRSAHRAGEVFLMREGKLVPNSRATSNRQTSLFIEAVNEGDEGVYTVKNPEKPEETRRITLIVRGTGWYECVWYIRKGEETWHIALLALSLSFSDIVKHLVLLSLLLQWSIWVLPPPLDDIRATTAGYKKNT